MGIVSRAIPTLLRGVSQAADSTKQADHADIQDNANSSPVQGLTKRSGSQYLATLSTSEISNVHVHTINRDENERYQVVLGNGTITVYDLDGNSKTVHTPDGISYLTATDPRTQLKTVTVADYTFVVNTTITAKMQDVLTNGPFYYNGTDSYYLNNQAIVFFNQVSANTEYKIEVAGRICVYDSGTSDLKTTVIAEKLANALTGNESDVTAMGSVLSTIAPSGFNIQRVGSVLWIHKKDNTSFNINVDDSQGNSQITLVKNSVQTFTDLPTVAPNGYVVEIKGDETTNFDNYYVKFVTNNDQAFEEGQWEETVKLGIKYKFNYETMPHLLIRQDDGNFRFAKADGDTYTATTTNATWAQSGTTVTITLNNHGFAVGDRVYIDITSGGGLDNYYTIATSSTNSFTYTGGNSLTANGNCTVAFAYVLPKWPERTVGDLDTAPNPSFIGTKINNVIFFRNRLGFLADDNVILSRVSEFFNFFPETVTTVIDSDPIDVAASNTKVSILKHAVNMGEQLILFSDQSQFVLSSSSDTLTPKTANVVVATEFESSTAATPVGSGRSIYYLTKKGSFAGIREYITQEDIAIKDASDITIHIPKYIPSNIFKLAVSTSEDVLVLLGSDNPNKLYINRWLYGEDFNKVLNSWSTFTFNSSKKILNATFIGTDLYLVVATSSETYLEKIPFEADYKEINTDFEYHLDSKITEATTGVSISYNSILNKTTWNIPYWTHTEMTIVGRYLADGETSTFVPKANANVTNLKPGQVINTTTPNTDGNSKTITAIGDYRLSKVIIGEPFEMHYRFSQQRLTDGSTGKTADSEYVSGRLQLHHFYLKYEDTGFFKVEVTPENRDTSTYKFTGQLLGSASSTIGQVNLETGTFRVPIMSRADRVDVDVKNNTFLPTQLSSAEYEARFHMRSRRI
tara:strand:- start:260 stop:3004 length:2745 start_codon:yes stop_codon:yes gene_type:complete